MTKMTSSKIRMTSLQRRSVIFLFTGIICGQLSCHFLISALRDSNFITCSFQELVIDTREKISNFKTGVTSDSSIPKLLFVGVMTSRRYLRTRARAIYDTWGAAQNGSLLFFVGGNDDVDEKVLPVQILSDVIDSQYPPQRKSFAMLEFMHQKYGRKYEWFMRADDDVFVDVDRLRTMLSSVDSSRPLYLGHPGTGKADEEGKLGLKVGAPYCMGGTGVLLSRAALEAVIAQKDACLRNTVSDHEDSELGRCVYNTTGVSCVKSEHIYLRFKQNYDDTSGEWIERALRTGRPYVTFHPVKDTRYMYHGAALLGVQRVSKLQHKVRQLQADTACLEDLHASLTEIDDPEVTEKLCLFNNCSSDSTLLPPCELGKPRRQKHSYFDLYPDSSWFLVRQNTFYTSLEKDLRRPANYAGVTEGLTKALRHLSRYIIDRQRHSRRSRLVAVDNFYRRVIPNMEVEYMTFIRDASANLRPYAIRQTFDDLVIVEKKYMTREH